MSGLFLPFILAAAAIVAAFATYRGIRRGGARYYTLERESLLRQASLMLAGSTLLFLGAITLLVMQQQQIVAEESNNGDAEVTPEANSPAVEETPELNNLPPLPTETPLPGPTLTPTSLICRGSVEGTFDNGLTLRETPGGTEIDVLAEASIVTILTEEETVEANGFVWRKVRSLFGDEGWVADEFLTLGLGCE